MTTEVVADHTVGIRFKTFHERHPLPTLNVELLARLMEWAEYENQVTEGLIVRDRIPEEYRLWGDWDQGVWGFLDTEGRELTEEEKQDYRNGVCRTAFCMAGQAATQSGYRLIFGPHDNSNRERDGVLHHGFSAQMVIQVQETGRFGPRGFPIMEDVPGANRQDVGAVGRDVLGLNHEESSAFFDGDNNLLTLQRYCNTFYAARNLPPLYPGLGMAYVESPNYEVTNAVEYPESDDDY